MGDATTMVGIIVEGITTTMGTVIEVDIIIEVDTDTTMAADTVHK